MKYKEYKRDSYNLYTIKTDKFRTCQIEIVFRQKLSKEKITINNLLIDCLTYTSKKYPRRKDVVEALEELYSANLLGITSRVGNALFSNIILEFLDPKYCDKDYLDNILAFPFEMLFNPNIENDEFDLHTFNIMKNRNMADIKSVKDIPSMYAIKRSIIIMDNTSPTSFMTTGYLEDLDNITSEDLVKAYKELLNNAVCDIYIIGNLDMDYVDKKISILFNNRYIKELDIDYFVNNKLRKKVLDIVETGNYEQSNLVLLYNTDKFSEQEMNYTIHVFNYIFGNGSLTTKLYKYLREENSLCYNAYSIYQKLDNLLIIFVGIDYQNKKKCVKLINKALKEMVNGIFSEEDILYAKKSLISNVESSMDNPSSLLDNYVFHNVVDTPLLSERKKELNKITKKDIIELSKKIKLNTIYMLGGPTDEKN